MMYIIFVKNKILLFNFNYFLFEYIYRFIYSNNIRRLIYNKENR